MEAPGMSGPVDDRKGTETLTPAATKGSAIGRRAKGRSRRKSKVGGPTLVLVVEPSASNLACLTRRIVTRATVQNLESCAPEDVKSLANYEPRSKTYRVSLIFSGEAGSIMRELMAELQVNTPNEVVKPAISLLMSAVGKEILLRDPKTGTVNLIEL
jgi:hypothetical protein